jgi:hypothetical protein
MSHGFFFMSAAPHHRHCIMNQGGLASSNAKQTRQGPGLVLSLSAGDRMTPIHEHLVSPLFCFFLSFFLFFFSSSFF